MLAGGYGLLPDDIGHVSRVEQLEGGITVSCLNAPAKLPDPRVSSKTVAPPQDCHRILQRATRSAHVAGKGGKYGWMRFRKASDHPAESAALQMSPNTAPGSTEANWSRSPSSNSLASRGTASKSFAIKGRSTMDASSTTIISKGSGLLRLCRKVREPGMKPIRRCSVEASSGMRASTSALTSRVSLDCFTASFNRAAAFPVGAARAIRIPSWPGWARSNARILRTVDVLPVPGPPVTSENLRRIAVSAASLCQSSPSPALRRKQSGKPLLE